MLDKDGENNHDIRDHFYLYFCCCFAASRHRNDDKGIDELKYIAAGSVAIWLHISRK